VERYQRPEDRPDATLVVVPYHPSNAASRDLLQG
jgi:hypothetical protein